MRTKKMYGCPIAAAPKKGSRLHAAIAGRVSHGEVIWLGMVGDQPFLALFLSHAWLESD